MKIRITRSRLQTFTFGLLALSILVFYEACSPMRSYDESAMGNSTSNICSSTYDPPTSLTSKAVKASSMPFEIKKVHINASLQAKAGSLKNQDIIVTLDTNCISTSGSLSEQVRLQNSNETVSFARHAFSYTVTDSLSIDNLTDLANADSCVLGITPPGQLEKASLPLPSTNDSFLSKQTYLQTLNYAHAYQYLVQKRSGSTKANVGFVDTGGDCSHPDISSNLISNCGYDAINHLTPTDNDGHGSHVLGMVGAATNNATGVLGIASNGASLHAIKVIDVDTGTEQAAYDGIQYAIAQNLDVINISLQSSTRLTLIEQGVQEAVAAGIVVVLAAGNQGALLGSVVEVSPAMVGKDIDGAITVGSIDAVNRELSYFSNYGPQVEIAATGAINSSLSAEKGGIYSTSKNNTYKYYMGTSQAAPVVTGAATLLVQFFKEHSVPYTPADIENIIKNSADKNPKIDIQGNRVINFSRLTRAAYQFAHIDLCQTSNP